MASWYHQAAASQRVVAAVAAVSTIALLLGAAARGASTGVTLIGAAEARPVVGEDAQELGVASIVQGVKAEEAASEAEMKRLMAITHKKSEDLRRVLDGDTFNPQVLAKHATAAHPGAGHGRGRRIRARAAPAPSRVRAAAPAVSAGYPVEGVDERIATLFGAARSRLLRDVKRTLRDLKRSPSVRVLSPGGETSVQVSAGAQFKRQQVLRLMHDKAAVTGDERLLGLLAAKQRLARAQELRDVRLVVPRERMDAIDLFARRDLLRAASAGDAPRLHAHKLSKAGNVVSKVAVSGNPFAPESLGLLGGEQGDRGSQVLRAAGIRTDALPGFGEDYAKAIPLPFFETDSKGAKDVEVEDDTRALRGVSAGTLERTASFSRSLFMNLSLLAKNLTGLTSMEPRELDAQTTDNRRRGAAGAPSLTVVLSQRKRDGDGGTTSYEVVVSRGAGDDEVQHEYCLYHPMAGPVKPHAVTGLHLDGVTVRWEWSENAFDLASPGAFFARRLKAGRGGVPAVPLAWAGEVVRTPKEIIRPAVPAGCTPPAGSGALLAAGDVLASSEHWTDYGDDHVKVVVSHAASGSWLEWLGTSTAENQSIRSLKTRAADKAGFVWVEFVYAISENGDRRACNEALLVTLREGKLAWVPCKER